MHDDPRLTPGGPQVDPKLTLGQPQGDPRLTPGCMQPDRAWFQFFKLKYDEPLSNIAYDCKLRRYNEGRSAGRGRGARGGGVGARARIEPAVPGGGRRCNNAEPRGAGCRGRAVQVDPRLTLG